MNCCLPSCDNIFNAFPFNKRFCSVEHKKRYYKMHLEDDNDDDQSFLKSGKDEVVNIIPFEKPFYHDFGENNDNAQLEEIDEDEGEIAPTASQLLLSIYSAISNILRNIF